MSALIRKSPTIGNVVEITILPSFAQIFMHGLINKYGKYVYTRRHYTYVYTHTIHRSQERYDFVGGSKWIADRLLASTSSLGSWDEETRTNDGNNNAGIETDLNAAEKCALYNRLQGEYDHQSLTHSVQSQSQSLWTKPHAACMSSVVSLFALKCVSIRLEVCLFMFPCVSLCLEECLFMAWSVSLYFYVCLCVSLCVFVSLYVLKCVSLCLCVSLYVSVCLSCHEECLSMSWSVSVYFLKCVSICLEVYLFMSLCVSLCCCVSLYVLKCVTLCLKVCLFVSVCVSLCLCVSLYVSVSLFVSCSVSLRVSACLSMYSSVSLMSLCICVLVMCLHAVFVCLCLFVRASVYKFLLSRNI